MIHNWATSLMLAPASPKWAEDAEESLWNPLSKLTMAGTNTNTTISKKAVKSLKFVVERRFNFALCDVRLSLRHLGNIKMVSKKVDSFKVTRTM